MSLLLALEGDKETNRGVFSGSSSCTIPSRLSVKSGVLIGTLSCGGFFKTPFFAVQHIQLMQKWGCFFFFFLEFCGKKTGTGGLNEVCNRLIS